MASITRLKSGKHRVRVKVKGRPPVGKTFERLTDARQWAQQAEADIRREMLFPTPEARKHTLAEALDRYEREVLPEKAETTQAAQRAQITWWRARLGDHFLADIRTPMVGDARQVLLDSGMAAATANRYTALLSGVFSTAVKEWEWTFDNPCSRLRAFRETGARIRFLDERERRALLDACADHPHPHLHDVVVLALHTGMRKNEILTITWAQLDLDREQIRLTDSKNHDQRVVPLLGAALTAMRERARVRRIDTNLVFYAPTKPCVPCDIDRAFAEARETAGLADFVFHDLRHTAASYLAQAGCSLHEIGQMLGHRDVRVTAKYAHLCQAHTRAVGTKLADYLEANGSR